MLRDLAFRNWMGAANWNMARSGGPNPARRNLSQCSRDAQGRDQRPRAGTRDVALGARPRPKKLAHERIRDPTGHRKRISARPYHPSRRGLDPRLFGLDCGLYAPAGTPRPGTFSRFRNSGNMEFRLIKNRQMIWI